MQICKRLAIDLAFCSILISMPALAQTGQSNQKNAQVTSRSSAVKSFRPFRIRFGGFTFGAGYSRHSGYYPYYPYYANYPFYRPWYYDPFYPSLYGYYFPPVPWHMYGYYSPPMYHPGWYTGFAGQSGMGEIRLQSNLRDADVFINDALAGKVKDLKTVWLEPGAYILKVQAENYAPFTERIYVLSGKALKIDANLVPQKEP